MCTCLHLCIWQIILCRATYTWMNALFRPSIWLSLKMWNCLNLLCLRLCVKQQANDSPSSSFVRVTVAMSLTPIMAPIQWSPCGLPRCTWNSSSGSNTESSWINMVQFFTCQSEARGFKILCVVLCENFYAEAIWKQYHIIKWLVHSADILNSQKFGEEIKKESKRNHTFSPFWKVILESSAFLLSSKSSITIADIVRVKQRTEDL